jgi:hypothetical protein
MPAQETRYTITEPGHWELVGGGTGDKRIHGRAYPADPGEDAIWHDIRVQHGRDWGYSDDVWGEANICHVILSRERLQELRDRLRSWLALSLPEMREQHFVHSSDLSPVKSSSVTLTFGARTDLVTGGGQTGCGLVVEVGALRVETRFVVNPTDLEAFAEGVEGVVSGARHPT